MVQINTKSGQNVTHKMERLTPYFLFFIFLTVLNSPPRLSKPWESTKLFNGEKKKKARNSGRNTETETKKNISITSHHFTPNVFQVDKHFMAFL